MCDGGLPARRYYELDWQARTFIAAEVAAALLHLHGLGLTHGRLQPSTVLLGEGLTAKLGDSGLHCYGGLDVVYPFATTAVSLLPPYLQKAGSCSCLEPYHPYL